MEYGISTIYIYYHTNSYRIIAIYKLLTNSTLISKHTDHSTRNLLWLVSIFSTQYRCFYRIRSSHCTYVSSYLYRTSLWISGIVLYLLLMIIGFMGYILAWGQLSFWAGTVICNIFKPMNLLLLVTG